MLAIILFILIITTFNLAPELTLNKIFIKPKIISYQFAPILMMQNFSSYKDKNNIHFREAEVSRNTKMQYFFYFLNI